MKSQRRTSIVIAFALMLSIFNFSRIQGNENLRAIQFISIFFIGALAAVLLIKIIQLVKANKQN